MLPVSPGLPVPPGPAAAVRLERTARDAGATRAFGAALGRCLSPAAPVTLSGGPGARTPTFAPGLPAAPGTPPGPGAAINGDVPILGTAIIDSFQKYELAYKQEPSGDDAYIYFAGGTSPVVGGQLGVFVQSMSTAREQLKGCLLYTSDAADERSSVDLGGRRIIKKKEDYYKV